MIWEINYILLMKKHNVSCIKNNRADGIDSVLGLGIPVFNGLHAILPEDLGTQLRGCIQRDNRVIVIPIGLPGHANLLIYRPTLVKVERFEPHGLFLNSNAQHATELKTNAYLKELFETKLTRYIGPVDYIPPSETCPDINGRKWDYKHMKVF